MKGVPYPIDDADLALIEINHPSPLVQTLIWELRQLRDENLRLSVAADEAYLEAKELRERE